MASLYTIKHLTPSEPSVAVLTAVAFVGGGQP